MKENSKDMQDMPAGEDLEKEQIKEQTGDPAEDMKDKNHPKHKHKKEEVAEKTAEEIAELKDKYLRLFSEYDNYRKRTLKEKLELTKTASADVITSLLPVLDDFERAIKSLEDSGETGAHQEGMLLIYNKLKNLLQQQGLEPINALGEDFDTDFHEALTNIPASSPEQKGKVLDVIQQGYKLGEKVIRFAKVVVGN